MEAVQKEKRLSHGHYAECGISARFRTGEHHAFQLGICGYAQSGVFRPCQALEAAQYLRRADELCYQCRRRLRTYQIRLGACTLYQPLSKRYKIISAYDDETRRGCFRREHIKLTGGQSNMKSKYLMDRGGHFFPPFPFLRRYALAAVCRRKAERRSL